jgi:antitoxin HicB
VIVTRSQLKEHLEASRLDGAGIQRAPEKLAMSNYTILLLPENDGSGFTVEVPALPGVVSFGTSREEAVAMAREAIELYLETAREKGWQIPEERNPPEIAKVEIDRTVPLRRAG